MMFIEVCARFVHVSSSRNPLPGSTRGLRRAAECLGLDALASRAQALDALDARLRRLMPTAVAGEVRLADVRNGRLVFLASSPTWASRLRLCQAALLTEACTALAGTVDLLVVKVAPLRSVPAEPAGRKPLSRTTAQHLRAAADTVRDPELRALYLHLASFADE